MGRYSLIVNGENIDNYYRCSLREIDKLTTRFGDYSQLKEYMEHVLNHKVDNISIEYNANGMLRHSKIIYNNLRDITECANDTNEIIFDRLAIINILNTFFDKIKEQSYVDELYNNKIFDFRTFDVIKRISEIYIEIDENNRGIAFNDRDTLEFELRRAISSFKRIVNRYNTFRKVAIEVKEPIRKQNEKESLENQKKYLESYKSYKNDKDTTNALSFINQDDEEKEEFFTTEERQNMR